MEKEKNIPLSLAEISEAAQKRVNLITKEFSEGFEFIKNYPRSVTFFGSARTVEGDTCYDRARDLARRIVSELRYTVVTGGGPGVMEAANRGAFEAGGNSIGLTIDLPSEQETNKYLTDRIDFHYFFSRKVCLSFSAEAYVFFPGGFGTLDEFLEILTLVQTGKITKAPIILFGPNFWTPLHDFFRKMLVNHGRVDESDLTNYIITESEEEVLEIIKNAPIRVGVRFDEKSEEPISGYMRKNGHGGIDGLLDK